MANADLSIALHEFSSDVVQVGVIFDRSGESFVKYYEIRCTSLEDARDKFRSAVQESPEEERCHNEHDCCGHWYHSNLRFNLNRAEMAEAMVVSDNEPIWIDANMRWSLNV